MTDGQDCSFEDTWDAPIKRQRLSWRWCLLILYCAFVHDGIARGFQQAHHPTQSEEVTIQFDHGEWFDGSVFRPKVVYSVGGVLSFKHQKRVTRRVDLRGGFVVPPYGDAHEHNFANAAEVDKQIGLYLRDGVFYAQGVTESYRGFLKTATRLNRIDSVDATFAHGGITGDQGHPKEIYELIALGLLTSPGGHASVLRASSELEGDAYWTIRDVAELEKKWPAIIAMKPDLLKLYLVSSEFFAEQQARANTVGDRGVNPTLVPYITEMAHHAGLKVVAHVDTSFDYHTALAGGVDELGHLPGYCRRAGVDSSRFRISDDDVALTAKLQVKVIATASICDFDGYGAENRAATRSLQTDNLERLKAAGVQILIGSDYFGEDSVHEANYLNSLGIWTNAELLRMWSEATPLDIFPNRKIGKLADGYEASFLVLQRNPIETWSATSKIASRWKRGREINIPSQIANSLPKDSKD